MEMDPSRHKIKPTGRPVKAIKREVRACIRFTRPEYLVINEKAGKSWNEAVSLPPVFGYSHHYYYPPYA